MQKTILITGSTDGIGLETAKMLASKGHHILLHGRNAGKLAEVEKALAALPEAGRIETYVADLSHMAEVESLAKSITEKHAKLDVLINNAGVFKVPNPRTDDDLDIRFVVNTVAPYLLTQRLLPLIDNSGRIVNLSSAAQSPVDLDALTGSMPLSDNAAYAQSKLALTMWSRSLALSLEGNRPVIISVNPGSMLASKMAKEAYGVAGGDLQIGAEILTRAALSDDFATASGEYFDNDAGQFSSPHPDGLNQQKCDAVIAAIQIILDRLGSAS